MIHRRGLLLGLASALAAPAIVRAASLMPVSAAALHDAALQGIAVDWGRGPDFTAFMKWTYDPITNRLNVESISFDQAYRQDPTIIFDADAPAIHV